MLSGAGYLWLLGVIALFSLALRGAVAVEFSGMIDGEGAEYARIAQNLLSGVGYVGIATEGKQLFFPPMFPWTIAAIAFVVGDAEIAARVISVISGSLITVPVYFVARRLYGNPTGLGAAALVGFHPHLVQFSTTAFCEPFFMTLALTGICMAMRCWDEITLLRISLLGLLYGAAYLVRPEALAYFAIVVALIVWRHWSRPQLRRHSLGIQALILISGFLVLAGPYTAWLSVQAGKFILQGKSSVNLPTERRMQEGMSEYEAAFGVAPDLTTQGPWMIPNITAIRQFSISAGEMPMLIATRAKRLIRDAMVTLSSNFTMGGPALFALAVLGCFARPWTSRQILDQLHLLLVLVIALFGLVFTYALQFRFYVIFIPLFCIWAAHGIRILCRWAQGTLAEVASPRTIRVPVAGAVSAIAAIAIWVPAGSSAVTAMQADRAQRAWKEEFVRMSADSQQKLRLSATWTPPAFHARAEFTWLPYSDAVTARRYLDRAGVTHVVLWKGETTTPYSKSWSETGLPNSRLVADLPSLPSGPAIRIYELSR